MVSNYIYFYCFYIVFSVFVYVNCMLMNIIYMMIFLEGKGSFLLFFKGKGWVILLFVGVGDDGINCLFLVYVFGMFMYFIDFGLEKVNGYILIKFKVGDF